MGLRRSRGANRGDAEELELYRSFVRALTRTCEVADRGDLESRSRLDPAMGTITEIHALHDALNRMLDVSDAFVRESSAALTSAAEGRFHRRLLEAFRTSAQAITAARGAMRETAGRVTEAQTSRLRLADEFESAVLAMSEQVATASTEMNASASGLSAAAAAASTEVNATIEAARAGEAGKGSPWSRRRSRTWPTRRAGPPSG